MVRFYQPTRQVVHRVVYQVPIRIFHYNIPERGSFLHKNSCLAYSSEQRRQSWLFLLHVFILIILLFFAKLIKHLMTVWVILTSVLFITLTFEISLLLTNVSGSKRFNLFLLKSFLVQFIGARERISCSLPPRHCATRLCHRYCSQKD